MMRPKTQCKERKSVHMSEGSKHAKRYESAALRGLFWSG